MSDDIGVVKLYVCAGQHYKVTKGRAVKERRSADVEVFMIAGSWRHVMKCDA